MKKNLIFAFFVFFSGCTTLNTQGSFTKVREAVHDSTGHTISWDQQTKEDVEVGEHLATLLQSPLTLKGAVQVALLNNPALQAEYEELGVSQAALVQAGLLRNPVLSAERRFRGRAAEVDITQEFLSVFFIPLRRTVAKAALKATEHRVAQKIITYVNEVKAAFYSLQGELQNFEMRESIVKTLNASYSAISAMRRAGNVSLLDQQNEAALLARAKVELAQSSLRVLEGRERLSVLMGVWGKHTHWKIDSHLPNIPSQEVALPGLESFAVAHRLDLKEARSELERIASQVGISQLEALLPDITFSEHFEREPEGSSTRGPSIDIPLPLFNWGKAAKAEGEAYFRQAERRYKALAIEIRSQVRVAYGRMKGARERAEYYYKEVLPLQQQMLEEAQRFNNGMFLGISQLLQLKQAQINTGQEYIEAIKEYWLARTELEGAIGGKIFESSLMLDTSASHHPGSSPREAPTGAKHHHHGS